MAVNESNRTHEHPLYDTLLKVPGLSVGIAPLDQLLTWGQKNALWIFPMATSCCGIEFMAAAASRVDLDRMGTIVRGTPRQVTDEAERLVALRVITDHIVANWEHLRPPSESELRATRIIALPLDEMSAKVRTGPPVNDDVDANAPHWCGEIPLVSAWAAPITAPDSGAALPASIAAITGRGVTP